MAEVLVVDDSATVRIQVRFILQKLSHRITEAPDAKTALEILSQRSFDLIITDLTMPGMDGQQFIREVRALPQLDRVPIVVMTARGAEEEVEDAFAGGATGFVVKPVSEKDLTQAVERQLPKTL